MSAGVSPYHWSMKQLCLRQRAQSRDLSGSVSLYGSDREAGIRESEMTAQLLLQHPVLLPKVLKNLLLLPVEPACQ